MIRNFINIKKFNKFKKINFYLILIGLISLSIYPIIPKFYDYNKSISGIKKALITQNNLNLNSFSEIKYNIFPTPRIKLKQINLSSDGDLIQVNKGELNIILNFSNILNYKKIKYNKLLIDGSFFSFEVDDLLNISSFIRENKRNIIIKKSNLILLQDNKFFLEIKDIASKFKTKHNYGSINLSGFLSEQKIFIKYIINSTKNDQFILNIPGVDTMVKVFLKRNNNTYNGSANIEVMNNYLQLDFDYNNEFKFYNSFLRNKLVSTKINGKIKFKPTVYFDLVFDFNKFNFNKIKARFENIFDKNEINYNNIKKINGKFNFTYKDNFNGNISMENGEIYFKNLTFKTKKYDLKFNGNLRNINNNQKLNFILISKFQDKKKSNEIIFDGVQNITLNKLNFKKILFNKKTLPLKDLRKYERKIKNKKIDFQLIDKLYSEIVDSDL